MFTNRIFALLSWVAVSASLLNAQPNARLVSFTGYDAKHAEQIEKQVQKELQSSQAITLVDENTVTQAVQELALADMGFADYLSKPQAELLKLAGGSRYLLFGSKDASGNPVEPATLVVPETAKAIATSVSNYILEDSERRPLRFAIEQQHNIIEDKKQGKKMFWVGIITGTLVTDLGYFMDAGFIKMAAPVGFGTVAAMGFAD